MAAATSALPTATFATTTATGTSVATFQLSVSTNATTFKAFNAIVALTMHSQAMAAATSALATFATTVATDASVATFAATTGTTTAKAYAAVAAVSVTTATVATFTTRFYCYRQLQNNFVRLFYQRHYTTTVTTFKENRHSTAFIHNQHVGTKELTATLIKSVIRTQIQPHAQRLRFAQFFSKKEGGKSGFSKHNKFVRPSTFTISERFNIT